MNVHPTRCPVPCRVLINKSALPGSDGSATRADVTAAGVIIVFVANYLLYIAFALLVNAPTTSQISNSNSNSGNNKEVV